MSKIKLFDAELKLMEILWNEATTLTAKQISEKAASEIGWNKNTTYTVIKKLVAKNAIKRIEPNYLCKPIISLQDIQKDETRMLIDKLFQGSTKLFFSSLIKNEELSDDEVDELKELINKRL